MQREKKKVKRFSKFMNNKMDYILFITVLILLSLGVVMVLSASAPSALSSTGKSYTYFLKQFEFALVGIGLMLFFSKSDYRFLKKYYKVIYVISVAILLLVLVPKLGKSVNGAKRWIEIKGCRLLHFMFAGLAGVAGVALVIIRELLKGDASDSFRMDRIMTFFDPWSDATGTGYQMVQSLYAISSGGLFGVGLGNSKQKYLYIPEPQNDFIFAIVAEELGFVGCVTIILLFAIFVWRGIVISMKAPDMFGSLLAIGVTTLVATQAIINIAVVTASIPTTGMALPFFSYRRNRTVSTTGWSGNFA